jgi:hypothetical protein
MTNSFYPHFSHQRAAYRFSTQHTLNLLTILSLTDQKQFFFFYTSTFIQLSTSHKQKLPRNLHYHAHSKAVTSAAATLILYLMLSHRQLLLHSLDSSSSSGARARQRMYGKPSVSEGVSPQSSRTLSLPFFKNVTPVTGC